MAGQTERSPEPGTVLRWYADMGIDEVIGKVPSDFSTWMARREQRRRSAKPSTSPIVQQVAATISGFEAPVPTDEAVEAAQHLAAAAATLDQLRAAITGFDGCPLKSGARNTVICDGIDGAPLMILGEAPGRDEDRVGRPFVGRAGQLLDKMLAAIGHSRFEDDLKPAFISNSIFWRPPGNRTPTKSEIAICLPFVQRMIELAAPKVMILVGNTPTQTLFEGAPGITRTRGIWREHVTSTALTIPVLPMFHPAFLLRQPAQKRLTWADLIAVKKQLESI